MRRDDYDRGRKLAQRLSGEKIAFVMEKLPLLRRVDKKGKGEAAAKEFYDMYLRREPFSENQMNYIDGLYEQVMKGAGLPSCNLHIDKKRKGLRYG